MSNIRYLIKVTATANPNNPNYAGAVLTYYYGRGQSLMAVHSEGVTPPEEMDFCTWLIREYGYKTRNTKKAEQFWTSFNTDTHFLDPENRSYWTYETEIVAYNLETHSLVNNIA